jgi:hypothetical protein
MGGVAEVRDQEAALVEQLRQLREVRLAEFVAELNTLCHKYRLVVVGRKRGINVLAVPLVQPAKLEATGNPWGDGDCYLTENW